MQLSWRQICSKNCRSTEGFGLSLKYTAASNVNGTLSDDGAEMKSACFTSPAWGSFDTM